MTLTITIDCDNAAFEPSASSESARILRGLADAMDYSTEFGDFSHLPNPLPLRDINGNRVGQCDIS